MKLITIRNPLFFAVLSWALSSGAMAAEELCGTIENARGQVSVLDGSRTGLIDVIAHAPFACGDWFSIGAGESELTIRLKAGHEVKLGPGTFAQSNSSDFTLYRGFIYLSHIGTGSPVRMITPNSKIETAMGKTLVIYSAKGEETQVVALEKSATIENRLKPDARKVLVKAGESSSLHFRVDRLDPTTPQAIAVAGLRETLAALTLEEESRLELLHTAFLRSQKKLPDSLLEENQDGHMAAPALAEHAIPAESHMAERLPASESPVVAHQTPVGKKSKHRSVGKLLGDSDVTESDSRDLLYPKEKTKLLKELKELRPDSE